MEEFKKKIEDLYNMIEVFKTNNEIVMTDEQIECFEKIKFEYFLKGYVLASLIEKKQEL